MNTLLKNRPVAERPFAIERTRNIGITAHVDAGKTTLTERILYYTGTIHHIGEVHDGNTTMDFDEIEKRKGITIGAAAISAAWMPQRPGAARHRINIIDTPGHVDFTAEVERSLRVLDGAIVVFSGVEGVQPQTEGVWRQAARYGVPRLAFINKMDPPWRGLRSRRRRAAHKLKANAWPVLVPIGREHDLRGQLDLVARRLILYDPAADRGEHYTVTDIPAADRPAAEKARHALVEALANLDDAIAQAFLEERDPSAEDLRAAIRRQTIANRFVPVIGGSAFKYVGVQLLLDAVVDYLPSPVDLPPAQGTDPDTGETVDVIASDDEPFRALVFKLATDEFARRQVFIRIYSGQLHAGDTVLNTVTGRRERISASRRCRPTRNSRSRPRTPATSSSSRASRMLSPATRWPPRTRPVHMAPPSFPAPVVSMAVEPKTREDQERLGIALQRTAEDDPTFRYFTDAETGQTIIAGMGELHLAVIQERMLTRYKVDTTAGAPQIAYRETITAPATGEGRQIKQTGGSGQYGHVIVEVRPGAAGTGVVVEDKVTGGRIPRQFINAVRRGIRDAMQNGPLGGHPVVDVEVDILDGSFHAKDSNDLAFQIAGSLAFKDAVAKAKPVLLEPIMAVECSTPPEFQGDVIGDLNRRRGQVREVAPRGADVIVSADVPLAEMFGYANAIRSLSKGRASYAMTPARFEPVPAEISRRVLGERKA
ncbi:MAG: elongation factor G [Verrucomicrobiota bacterium]